MAQLRTIEAYIESSGIDSSWIEADLYGSATVKQIIDGNHIRCGQEAHVITLQALFMLYQEAFFKQHPELQIQLEPILQKLNQSYADVNPQKVQELHKELLCTLESMQIMEKMESFNAARRKRPLFRVFHNYMQMIMEMLLFIQAVRTGDWELHLTALEIFTKYFFAHDKLTYARMIPLYLADMKQIQKSDVEIYEEFLAGNWVVNKNPRVSFCAIGADHALEHINRSMKVSGGLVGITLNPNARTKFFLISPQLARLAGEAQQMADLSCGISQHHPRASYRRSLQSK